MDVLSKLDFSLAFPMVGSVYVFNLLIGRFFFHDVIGWERILGVGLNPGWDLLSGEKWDVVGVNLSTKRQGDNHEAISIF